MDHYHIWFDLRPGVKDTDLAAAVAAWLDHLKQQHLLEGWSLQRRKLGLGPQILPEWYADIQVKDMVQLQAAFDEVTPRTGEIERLHAAVWSKVTNFMSGLWRDFPDANRAA